MKRKPWAGVRRPLVENMLQHVSPSYLQHEHAPIYVLCLIGLAGTSLFCMGWRINQALGHQGGSKGYRKTQMGCDPSYRVLILLSCLEEILFGYCLLNKSACLGCLGLSFQFFATRKKIQGEKPAQQSHTGTIKEMKNNFFFFSCDEILRISSLSFQELLYIYTLYSYI